MDVFSQSLGELLVKHAEETTKDILLAAPFIKLEALRKILSAVPDDCPVRVVTRWRLNEITVGASDLEVWELLKEQPGYSLELVPKLHAKYYRFDNVCLAGSANLTDTALGWHSQPNLEFLARFNSEKATDFEGRLEKSITVTESLYLQYQRLLDDYEGAHPGLSNADVTYPLPSKQAGTEVNETMERIEGGREVQTEWWIPRLRHPEALYRVYSSGSEEVSSATWDHGTRDLHYFVLPEGLDETRFELEVGWQLLQKPVVEEVDQFVETSKRFGAVRNYLRTLPCAENDNFDATEAWQTLMRWLLYFLGDRYRQYEANYSEIFVRDDE